MLSEKKFQIFLLIYVLLAPLSYHLLPYMGIYGSDLSMQFYFHHCPAMAEHSANLFQLAGAMCNDINNTHYAYPVLIYRLFSFSRFFETAQSMYYFWSTLLVLTLLVSPWFWLRKRIGKFHFIYLGIGLLTILQAPSFYALERGGTDIAFLLPWILATYFALKDKWVPAGILMAIAALLKLYPVMAIMPIVLGLFLIDDKKNFFKLSVAIGLTVIIAFSLDWHLWKIFILEVLPSETKLNIGTNAIGHSLIGPFSKFFAYPVMLTFWFLFAKIFALKTSEMRKLAFAGVLAMSTYFNGHSFDYNLITAFPFLYLAFELYFDGESPYKGNKMIMWGIIILCLTLLGPANWIFSFHKYAIKTKLLLELVGFALIPTAILKFNKRL